MIRTISRRFQTLYKKILDPASDKSQFSKVRLVNHGELQDGDIPEALKYDRPFELTTLANGVRVASEYWPSKLSTVGVLIEAGSRHETMANAGTAHFLEHLNFKGTKRRNRVDIERGTEAFGGNLNAFTSREMTLYQMQVF
jgi:processing peptidase subunit beta